MISVCFVGGCLLVVAWTLLLFIECNFNGIISSLLNPSELSDATQNYASIAAPLLWSTTVSIKNDSGERRNHPSEGISAKLLECRLPDIDPWDYQVQPYLNPFYDPMKNCKRTYEQITSIRRGYVVLNATYANLGVSCEFRCCYPKDDYELIFGEWMHITVAAPDCDVVEVRCSNMRGEVFYEYLHAQVYRKNGPVKSRPLDTLSAARPPIRVFPQPHPADLKATTEHRAPDVHIILFDSVSQPQFYRSMPRTVHVLREEMSAVPFNFVNKVGLNSRPNGYALLLGKQAYTIDASPLNEVRVPTKNMDEFCRTYMDNESFVGYEFQKAGYRTMMSEDWALGVFNWPDCYGFTKSPVDHYMRPFNLRVEGKYADRRRTLYEKVHRRSCKEPHHYQLNYLKDFIDAYDDEPKFSLTWMSCVAHDDVNGLYHVDHDWHRFLRDYKEKLSNSFLFVMGDHGNRFGRMRSTAQGELEDNNPALLVVVPERLRNNKALMENLRENSRQLVTHYDTYATLVSIAKEAKSMTADTKFDKQPDPKRWDVTLQGQSYLYPLSIPVPRNCPNQLIPFDYCICQFNSADRTKTKHSLAVRLAGYMVDSMNQALEENNATQLCMPLKLDSSAEVELTEWEPDLRTNVYRVSYQTLPGRGRFFGYVQVLSDDGNGGQLSFKMISTKMPRLNSYSLQAYCVSDPNVKSYCYCRSLLSIYQMLLRAFGMPQQG